MEDLPVVQRVDITTLLSQAIDSKSVEVMERVLAMQERLHATYAREQFDSDMSAFQAECPTIKKTKAVRTKKGAIAYRYAPIDSIIDQVKHLLSKHGFSYAVDTVTHDNGMVTATCIVKHILGHRETSPFTVPLGNKTDIMSDSQVVAAALTFAKRYAFCNAFGILTGDEDTDGKVTDEKEPAVITPEQSARLLDLRMQTGYPMEKLLSKSKEQDITKITAIYADALIKFLEKKAGNNE